jgi:signal transduction histidine kinase
VLFRRLLAIISLSLLACCVQAQSDLIRERGIYVDETQTLSIEEVVGKEFGAFTGLLKRSLTPRVRWVRLIIDKNASSDTAAVLVVGPHYLAEIALYERHNGEWLRRVVGDRYPNEQLGCPVGQYCFSIQLDQLEGSDLYLRVATTNGYYLTAKLFDRLALNQENTDQALSAGLECGVLIALIVLSVLLFFTGGGALAAYFFATQVTALLLTLSVLGVYAKYLTPETAWVDNLLFNVLYVTRLLVSVWLSVAFFQNLVKPTWYLKLVQVVSVVFVFQLCWLVFEPVSLYSLAFNFSFVIFWPVIWVVALYRAGVRPFVYRGLMLCLATVMIFMLWADMLPALGLAQVDRMLVPGNFGGLLVSIFMSVLVASEIRIRRLNNQKIATELAGTQARNAFEHQQVKERSMMIDMLTHELKNPLAAMRMAAGSLKMTLLRLPPSETSEANERIGSMIQAINGMNTVIERCVQVDSLDQKKLAFRPEELDVEEILQDAIRESTDPSRIKLHIDSPSLVVKTDSSLFSVVVANLLDNALKYSEPESPVAMTASLDDAGAFTLVVENAVGSAGTPDPASIFSRYYRGEHAHTSPGTGLGLYLVKSICDILGAAITSQSTVEKVYFSVTLKP